MEKMKLLAILSLIVSSITYSDIQLDAAKLQNTTIEAGKRGNTIININTPNEKGISVNDFENFQTKNGVIFNNSGERMNISQLEGIISGNPNITGEQAKLILNRVGGANRTEIEGVLEAVGKEKVDMIFSSPNGIYLNGTNFIGFKDVTFTTAPVNLDGDGNIQTLTIDSGNIEVGRNGLDASKLEQLALLSKQISIDGGIKGKNIAFIAGEYDYNIANKAHIRTHTINNGISISLSEFGSIYGEQINIIATNGDIGIKADIISENRLDLIFDKITISDNSILNSEDITLLGIIDNYGTIMGGTVNIESRINSDIPTLENITFQNYGSIFSTNYLQIGSKYLRNYGLIYSMGNIKTLSDLIMGNAFLNEGTIEAFGNIELDFRIAGGNTNTGTIISHGVLEFGSIGNTGTIEAKGGVRGHLISNDGVLKVGGESDLDWLFNRNNSYFEGGRIGGVYNERGENSKIEIKNDLYVREIYNMGEIIVGNNVTFVDRGVSNQGITGNTGSIIIGGNLNYNYTKRFANDGEIIIGKDFIGEVVGYTWINNGFLKAKNIQLIASGSIYNNERIEATGNINISSSFMRNNGILNSRNNLEIKTKKLENSGELNAKDLKLTFKDFSSQGGKITADNISFDFYTE